MATFPTTPNGRRSELNFLLNRLLEADRSIVFYQQVSAKTREEIQALLDGLEELASGSGEE